MFLAREPIAYFINQSFLVSTKDLFSFLTTKTERGGERENITDQHKYET